IEDLGVIGQRQRFTVAALVVGGLSLAGEILRGCLRFRRRPGICGRALRGLSRSGGDLPADLVVLAGLEGVEDLGVIGQRQRFTVAALVVVGLSLAGEILRGCLRSRRRPGICGRALRGLSRSGGDLPADLVVLAGLEGIEDLGVIDQRQRFTVAALVVGALSLAGEILRGCLPLLVCRVLLLRGN